MAPVEFEKQIRESLDKRKIQPSEESWDRIRQKMGNSTPGRKSYFFSYAVAAAVAILLFSVIFFTKSSKDPLSEQQPVVNSLPDRADGIDQGEDRQQITTPMVNDPGQFAVTDSESIVAVEIDPQISQKEESPESFTHSQDSDPQTLYGDPIDQKVSEIVAQVDLMEEKSQAVTDEEVDSLLRIAQRELMANRTFREQNGIDAQSLLAGVENELDQSFRDQVFERLKTGFAKVRMAVAQRNK